MRRLLIVRFQVVHAATTPTHDALDGWKQSWSTRDWAKFMLAMQARATAAQAYLREAALWAHMTKTERRFVSVLPTDVTRQEHINASWLMEGAACLMWSLGLLSALPA